MGCMDIFSLCVCYRIWRRWRLVFMKDHGVELMKAASNDDERGFAGLNGLAVEWGGFGGKLTDF
jgi:hypothetical protein